MILNDIMIATHSFFIPFPYYKKNHFDTYSEINTTTTTTTIEANWAGG